MNKYRVVRASSLMVLLLHFVLCNLFAQQDHTIAFRAADTSTFSVNKTAGWQLFNAFIHEYKRDSAQIEVILQHSNTIDWKQEQYIGKIKPHSLHPSEDQVVAYSFQGNIVRVSILKSGKCYLQFVSGNILQENPVVIPLKLFYKLL